MTEPKKGTGPVQPQDQLEVKKQTLKDLPASGEDVKGGMRTRKP